ncbi:MAG TPA: PmoA family protein [Pyrinomonadaceae bacterium]|nr:PmoA family protein [Pyrinomonadaceae bacterium]
MRVISTGAFLLCGLRELCVKYRLGILERKSHAKLEEPAEKKFHSLRLCSTFAAAALVITLAVTAQAQFVGVQRMDSEKRAEITVNGKPFTIFRGDERIMRPVLYPIISAGGSFVTRGFPFDTRDGDTVDHPHQVGSSLSYGNVNGIDFWNSSTFRTPEEMKRMGRIMHTAIVSTKSGPGSGELVTAAAWIGPDSITILTEKTKYSFHVAGAIRWIDRETRLTALLDDVTFGDSKEGMFAIHLPSELEQNDQTKVKITNAKGVISQRERTDILSGVYSNSEGLTTESKIWGTLGKWAAVSGKIGSENVTVAMFDHPSNTNFPSRMMVRGYGLLALNPFGQKQFDSKLEERKFVVKRGESITFRYRLLIASGAMTNAVIEEEYKKFAPVTVP